MPKPITIAANSAGADSSSTVHRALFINVRKMSSVIGYYYPP